MPKIMRSGGRIRATMLAGAALIAASGLTAALSFPGQAEAGNEADSTKPKIEVQPQIPLDAAHLKMAYLSSVKVQDGGGEFESWESTVVVDSPRVFHFLWSTGKHAYAAAKWQVSLEGTAGVLASANLPAAPFHAQTQYDFSIDMKGLMPAKPGDKPKIFVVRVVPMEGQQALPASAPAKISYQKPGPAPVFTSDLD